MMRIYLDYAASTPVDRQVEAVMSLYFGTTFGNPDSLHGFGQEASRAVFEARRTIAELLGADYREIVFTGSATEANNLAIRGAVKNIQRPRIITTAIEHESILETYRDLEKDGAEVVYVPAGRDGLVDPAKIKTVLNERTVAVSVMHANNEIGTVQPIAEIAAIIAEKRGQGIYPLFHTDAAQSFQYLDCDVDKLGVDLLTLSAHKIYGPKGIGVLYVRDRGKDKNVLKPVITGGGQEFGLRSGTGNVPYIAGFAKAAEIADQRRKKEADRVLKLRDYFWHQLKKAAPKLEVNGSLSHRLPNNLNIYFPGQKAHNLLIELDLLGVAASPGAACSTHVSRASYVLEAMGLPQARAAGSLRFSLGRQTTRAGIDYAVKVIVKTILAQRKI